MCFSVCVYLKLQILSSANCPAQPRPLCGHILRVQFPFILCQTGANTGDNTLSPEFFSKYGGILEIHRADFNALPSLLHASVKILTAGLIQV